MDVFRVNHNGTEDWVEKGQPDGLPALALGRDDEGRALFTLDNAIAYGAEVAREVIAWEQQNAGASPERARAMLADTADGVPVQVLTEDGGVLGTIDPEAFT